MIAFEPDKKPDPTPHRCQLCSEKIAEAKCGEEWCETCWWSLREDNFMPTYYCRCHRLVIMNDWHCAQWAAK